MTALLLVALLLQQAPAPDVIVGVDRDRVAPGDVVTLTVTITSLSAAPVRVDLPPLGGFELESREERSDVTAGDAPRRVTTLRLTLRANAPGTWRVGPFTVRHAGGTTQADPVLLTIEGGSVPPSVSAGLTPRLARLLQQAPPPPVLGPAAVTLVVSDTAVMVGQQVDLVTIAWFDRTVRQQLRRAPTVDPPRVEGVWSYPQVVPGGIAASRQAGGRWYDLFVLHQVVFPLTSGRVRVLPARLTYSLPLQLQFFSQEERYTLSSDSASFAVRQLPDSGRPPDFAGAVGHGLTLAQRVAPLAGRQGDALSAEVVLSGEGNVALWPEPVVRWPAGFRVYPETATDRPGASAGRFGGARTFRYLLLADSAGTRTIPATRYSYFDPVSGDYQTIAGAATAVVIAPRRAAAARAAPPPIRLDRRQPVAARVRGLLAGWAWLALGLLPAAFLLPRLRPRRGRPPPAARAADPLADLEARLERALTALLPDTAQREGGSVELALVHAGIPRAAADRVVSFRTRLRQRRFGPQGGTNDAALVREGDALLAGLVPRTRRRQAVTGVVILLLLARGATAQGTPPGQLYEAGAYQAAAAGFAREVLAAPELPAPWFNLGAARFRAGDDAFALAAWIRAARLAPRESGVRRALLLLPPADAASARLLWVSPVTPDELWLVGMLVWAAGWVGRLWRRRWEGRWVVLLAGGVMFVAAAAALSRVYGRPVAVVAANSPLRLSPNETAPGVGELPRVGAVLVESRSGAWARVRGPGGEAGWILAEQLAPLDPAPGS